jgi:hypothetical protein
MVVFVVSGESVVMLVVGLDVLGFGVRAVGFGCQRSGCWRFCRVGEWLVCVSLFTRSISENISIIWSNVQIQAYKLEEDVSVGV